jgi:hypothetical protein
VKRRQRTRQWKIALLASLGLVAAVALISGGQARASAQAPEFTLAPDRGLVGHFDGFGAQFNQHLYANISGPPPDIPGLEAKVLALRPQFARVFFNTNAWTAPDRMASFVRTVQLAQRAQAQVNITWQGSTFAFAMANMPRFADVLTGLLTGGGIGSVWVTLFNEPNSTRITISQYEQVYRLLDAALRDRGVRDRVHFMGGDLVGTTSPLGQSQVDWFTYMAKNMGDLLDAWSIHVYWDFWDAGKIERRLATVRSVFSAIPAPQRRPLYVTEFGVRGLQTFEGESNFQPYLWPDGTPMAETTMAAFQEAWFMTRAAQLGYSAAVLWDLYAAKYDLGTQDYSAIGPGRSGWPLRPSYHLLKLMTATTEPTGGAIVDVVPGPGADPAKLLTAYASPGGGVTIFGLDTDGASLTPTADDSLNYSVGGLPPNTLFRLLLWNGDGSGTNVDVGFLDSGSSGTVQFAAPIYSVFALTSTSLGATP